MSDNLKNLRHKSFAFSFFSFPLSFFNNHAFLSYFCFDGRSFFTITKLYKNIRDGIKKIYYFIFHFFSFPYRIYIVQIRFIEHPIMLVAIALQYYF